MAAAKMKNPSLSLQRLLRSLSFLILFSPSLQRSALADDIFTSTSGASLGRSSREPKYKIEFHSAKSPFHPDDGQEAITMSKKDGQKYVCFLPSVEQTKTVKTFTQQNSSSIILETDRRIKLKTPDELLYVLKDKCFYRHEGWWSYEFCHLKHLRQLHLEDDKAVQEFYLGLFDSEATTAFNQNHSDTAMLKDPRSKDASQRYHAHQYTNGTICDLTNQPRETEVTNLLMFQQERPTWHVIHCNEIAGDNVKDSSSSDTEGRGTQISVVMDESDRYAT
ncbi:uncharacterized protein A4U43_C05F33230 [Asparagus officinalis]|uniref:Protein OS9-like domain-containing protein n=1 Tax=Asparagus officinalis TaxID=4686 RepID=A0A5P1F106_ASPOF|nr:uncharacterized protein A4U43_C05F33230 [Asparagus officinalis]